MEDSEDTMEEPQLDVNEELRKAQEKQKKAKTKKKKAQEKKKKAQQKKKKAQQVLKEKKDAQKKADDEMKNADNEVKKADNEVKKADNEVKKADNEVKKADNEVKKADNEVKKADNEVKKADNEVKKADNEVKKARDRKSLGTSELLGRKRRRNSSSMEGVTVPSSKRKVGEERSYITRAKSSTSLGSSSRAFISTSRSSSLTSQVMDPFKQAHYKIDLSSDYLKKTFDYYSLTDIARHFKVKIHDGQGTKKNKIIVSECLSIIVEKKWQVKCTATIDAFKNLSPMIASTNFIPDVVIKCRDTNIVGFLGEVHSSPYRYSINKAILGVTDLFRLHRAQGIDIQELRAFYFPKCEKKTCLVEIKVSFEVLQFKVELFAHSDMSEGVTRLCRVIQSQCNELLQLYQSRSPPCPSCSHFLFRLTAEECDTICGGGGKQMKSSSHIILQTRDCVMYKLLYDIHEENSLRRLMVAIKTCSRVIFPEVVEQSPLLYRYPGVKFSPLTHSKAKECLKSFIKEVKLALDELHQIGFSHNDLRLPNICFNEKYKAVLIDLDRVHPIQECYSMFFCEKRSCMYDLCDFKGDHTGKFTDFLQLGWLIAWIMHPVGNEHERKWESQPDVVRNNRFIKELIEKGTFNDNSLHKSFQEGKTLITVLVKST